MGATRQVQRGEQFAGYNQLETLTCANCSVLFAVPVRLLQARREDRETFYCPNGHSNWFPPPKVSAEEKLERERERSARLAAERDQLQASLRAQRGAATRARNQRDRDRRRIAAGVCPCCNRSFQNLAKHMAGQHPDYRPLGEDDHAE